MGAYYYQSETLVRNIVSIIGARNAKSLLDIGAGSPITGCQLAQIVSRYLAVEKNLPRANALKEAGLDVVCARFPAPIQGQFDIVLSSHSIPELTQATLDDYPPFIRAAWACVAPGGLLLIITFKGGAQELVELTSAVFAGSNALPRETGSKEYATLMSELSQLGSPVVERVCSHIVADTADDMRTFISPWITGTRRHMSELQYARLRIIVESRYLVRPELYVVATEHLFISLEKRCALSR